MTRAATNNYFDNRLVGRLFFGLNKIIASAYYIERKTMKKKVVKIYPFGGHTV